MSFIQNLSPIRAINDLRRFLAQRQRHELGFLALSIVITGLLIAAFVKDSHFEREYKRNIIYVESWPASRSDTEIRAKQKIDSVEERRAKADYERRVKERQASFKRLDDKLKAWGL